LRFAIWQRSYKPLLEFSQQGHDGDWKCRSDRR